METSIKQATPVEYEFEIHATAEDLESELQKALRAQRSQMDVKGFRKGKVPMELVKKMHGQAIGYRVAERYVQDLFEEKVEEESDLEPLGQPTMTELDYELEGDLKAVIRFGVRPEVELEDVSDVELSMLDHEVTDDDVEDEVERLQIQSADLMPVEDEPAGEGDFVNVDLQRIDADTDTPIIGDKEEGLTFFLDDERLRGELRDALIGKEAGDTFRVNLPADAPPEADPSQVPDEDRLYEVTLNDVKRRDLPPVDEAFVREITEGQFEDPEAFRQEIRDRLEEAWSDRAREMVQGDIIDKMLELHPVPVPESVVETYLDSFVRQVEEENDGELPDDFDEELFRQRNRDDAEKQGRWMLIRDVVIEENDIEATDEDLQEFFAQQAEGSPEVSAEQISQFYQQMPRMMERVKQQVLSEKVYDHLIDAFDVQKKTLEEFEDELEEKHKRRQELAGGAPHGHGR